ncbi:MAG: tRNA (5-methylaminomethyl-2-thiouridine)(34)-methyltransferase MnmD [Planctomycetota bacterium]
MEPVLTGDGSPTLWSRKYREHYHSLSGAFEEARERFVLPCRLPERVVAGGVRVLDIGFGLGWNLAWALLEARRAFPEPRLRALSLERDPLPIAILERFLEHLPDPLPAEAIRELARNGRFERGGISLQLLEGAAEHTMEKVDEIFDCVFLDPFSPTRNPELWTRDFLGRVRCRVAEGGILSTYSAAVGVKVALIEAGWEIGKGPRVGMKSSGTLASNGPADPPIPPLAERELRRLLRKAKAEVDRCDD